MIHGSGQSLPSGDGFDFGQTANAELSQAALTLCTNLNHSIFVKHCRSDEMPNGIELLMGIAFEDGCDLRLPPVGGEFGHLGVDVEARRVEGEALVVVVAHSLLHQREVDARCDLRLVVSLSRLIADGVTLPTIQRRSLCQRVTEFCSLWIGARDGVGCRVDAVFGG